eukprot:TRINITY_DN9665_c0_g1_i9.p1 TRINITY_DN9665_c0_g1~~TRINITY_DN9665_c0_g1_i9.p1  ORF type:complete len:108 (+),score=15.20 TRINITY_DN9665_c0_g1_i9:203-526(+)
MLDSSIPLTLTLVVQFHQFSGKLGPTALACDTATGNLYVAHSDFASVQHATGEVVVLAPSGEKLRGISIESAEITGLAIRQSDEPSVIKLVVTTATGKIYDVVDSHN